jgi:hypothetical protein
MTADHHMLLHHENQGIEDTQPTLMVHRLLVLVTRFYVLRRLVLRVGGIFLVQGLMRAVLRCLRLRVLLLLLMLHHLVHIVVRRLLLLLGREVQEVAFEVALVDVVGLKEEEVLVVVVEGVSLQARKMDRFGNSRSFLLGGGVRHSVIRELRVLVLVFLMRHLDLELVLVVFQLVLGVVVLLLSNKCLTKAVATTQTVMEMAQQPTQGVSAF